MEHDDSSLRPPHPRRPPAHKSVSLLHSPRPTRTSPTRERDTAHGVHDVQAPGPKPFVGKDDSEGDSSGDKWPPAVKLAVAKDDSGESSNADKWFDKSNNNVSDSSVVDNDPPFFLQRSSSEDKSSEDKSSPKAQNPAFARLNSQNLQYLQPMGDVLGRMTGDVSSTDDFRSVIDDLTVQNKKLKRRLKRYEMLHDAHLNNEKLFEVRVHGLPASKKKQLEELLRKFTLDLSDEKALANSALDPSAPALMQQQLSKSSLPTDSAYASASADASASGQGSSARSVSANGQNRNSFKPSALSRQHNIHNYLDDIPSGLLPQHTAGMSEKTKKKLVVRRLEQVFAGRGAVLGGHQQPEQQQEVSRLAAKADRTEERAAGQQVRLEGSREARIMTDDRDENGRRRPTPPDNVASNSVTFESKQQMDQEQKTDEHDFAEQSPHQDSQEQRPTRPLDLDPQRAQYPVENIEYMRHLGFSPPDAYSSRSPEEGHGWIYLNLLMNMAQLHTINVTTDFVKQALQEYSSRFELSSDGRKVRWRGKRNLTRTSSETSSPSVIGSPYCQSPRKRIKTSHTDRDSSGDRRNFAKQAFRSENNQLAYTPLFFQRSSEDSDVSSSVDDGMTGLKSQAQMTNSLTPGNRGSSGLQPSHGASASSARNHQKRQNGPIIFYDNAKFCTDLSGDNKTEAIMNYNPIMYHVATPQAVGARKQVESDSTTEETRGPLNDAHTLPEAMDLADNPIPPNMEITFPPQTPLTSGSEKSPFSMEASGLGGVYPADNFSINVRTKHSSIGQKDPEPVRKPAPGKYPSHIADILGKDPQPSTDHSSFHKEVLSTRQKDLPPSELPPASCYISLDDSDSDDESYKSSVSMAPETLNERPSRVALRSMKMPSWSSEESGVQSDAENGSDDDGDDVSTSDASLDLLASARLADPQSVRAREREYDAVMADRLAEEIPAGSSAATAGGGSGFGSPASGMMNSDAGSDAGKEAQLNAGAFAPTFRRAMTDDSMVVNGQSH